MTGQPLKKVMGGAKNICARHKINKIELNNLNVTLIVWEYSAV